MKDRLLMFLAGFLFATVIWINLFPQLKQEAAVAFSDIIERRVPVTTHDAPAELFSTPNPF